ncbi:MAG: SUMF1/EgtB/PvdO family nonheme iron enzyme [Sandaracinaceae bacterium]|nr:SUMF1/EgtB/PvdO family nonheme iron enzyme [Sandaracinaceae bacterium]
MRSARFFSVLVTLLCAGAAGVGCGSEADGAPSASTGTPATTERAALPPPAAEAVAADSDEDDAPAVDDAAAHFAAPRAGEQVSVPAGTVRAGSLPGSRSRSPLREADLVAVDVPAFRMDRLPYPNDPAQPPRTQVTRPQAEALCAERGQRLCDELEWERACKGDSTNDYVTGARFRPESCSDAYAGCTSPVGVSALGVAVAEWTSSPAPRALRAESATWMTRGASTDTDATEHRCGARHLSDPSAPNLRIGFRCCSGEAPSLSYPAHESYALHELMEADDATLAGYLRQMPEVARFAEGFVGTTSRSTADVLTRGQKTEEDLAGWRPITGLLRWSPTEGEHVWVFSGSGAGASLIVVAHPMPDGTLVHGASFVFEGETPPVIVAYSPGTPNALKWSTCWDCAGEGGVIMMRDGRVTIAQR